MSERCPTLRDLLDGSPQVVSHARGCLRCQALLSLGGEPPAEEAQKAEAAPFEAASVPARQPLAERALGEVVTIASPEPDSPLLLAVVLARTADDLQVAPISTEVTRAGEWDLIFEPTDTPLGYEVIAEVWNHGRIHASQVAESLAAIAPGATEQLLALYASLYTEAAPVEISTGPRILSEDDPRLLFQDSEANRARRFWSDAEEVAGRAETALAESTLGTRVFLWLEETGNDPSDLSREAGWLESDVELVLRDSIDPMRDSFSIDRIANLVGQTDIEGDEAEQLLLNSVPASAFSVAPPSTTETAWRRAPGVERRLRPSRKTGPSRGESEEPSPEQIAALQSWVRAVVELLEEG